MSRNFYEQLGGVVKRFLALEPAIIGALFRAVIYLGALVGWVIPAGVDSQAQEIFVAIVAVVEILTTIYTRSKVVPQAKVVEQISTDGTNVVAGPANSQVEEKEVVRPFDAPPRAPQEVVVRDPDTNEIIGTVTDPYDGV